MEKTARIFVIKEIFSSIDLVFMAPSVLVILHGFIR